MLAAVFNVVLVVFFNGKRVYQMTKDTSLLFDILPPKPFYSVLKADNEQYVERTFSQHSVDTFWNDGQNNQRASMSKTQQREGNTTFQ